MDDLISRSDVIDMLKREEKILYSPAGLKYLVRAIEALPSIQPEKRTQERTETHSCDCIERQAAIELIERMKPYHQDADDIEEMIANMPSAQPQRTDCEYCHEDTEGYVRPLEKNGHAFIHYGLNGWCVGLSARGWLGNVKINYCPMCGRRLTDG